MFGLECCDDWSTTGLVGGAMALSTSEPPAANNFTLSDSWDAEMQYLGYESTPVISEPGFRTNYDGIASTESVFWMA